MNSIPTEPYKGVRDFYPEDMAIQNYIFNTWKKSVESFGYKEYSASILEPSELYEAKTGEEIVSEQTYSFKDGGDRDVTLRPEMTPTVARMISKKKRELTFPLRWYSIPNVFRYEKPQRGRLREHTQLNVDLFGSGTLESDLELILLANQIMKDFGAKPEHFVIKINSRKILQSLYKKYKLSDKKALQLSKIVDKKNKIKESAFQEAVELLLGKKTEEFIKLIHSTPEIISDLSKDNEGIKEIMDIINALNARGITNIEFDPSMVRGFDYYTGILFEVFDTHKDNNHSIFGGGRYDNLLEIFGQEKVPAVGFGMGDVTLKDFLETHKLLPTLKNSASLYICTTSDKEADYAYGLSESLRSVGVKVEMNVTNKKVGDQVKTANKKKIPFIVCIGPDEVKTKKLKIKDLRSSQENDVEETKVAQYIIDNK